MPPPSPLAAFSMLAALPVHVTPQALVRHWIFPADRFTEHGDEDLWWAVKLNFGHWSDYQPGIIRIKDTLHVHPKIWTALKQKGTLT